MSLAAEDHISVVGCCWFIIGLFSRLEAWDSYCCLAKIINIFEIGTILRILFVRNTQLKMKEMLIFRKKDLNRYALIEQKLVYLRYYCRGCRLVVVFFSETSLACYGIFVNV